MAVGSHKKELVKLAWKKEQNLLNWKSSSITMYYSNWFKNNTKIIHEFLSSIEFNSLIEIGCNYGKQLNELAKIFPNKKFIGIDISEGLIKLANKEYPNVQNVSYLRADAETLSSELKADVVMANDMFSEYPTNGAKQMFNKMIEISNKYVILGREFSPEFASPESLDFVDNYPILTIHPFELWFKENNMDFQKINLGEIDEKRSRLNCMFIGCKK